MNTMPNEMVLETFNTIFQNIIELRRRDGQPGGLNEWVNHNLPAKVPMVISSRGSIRYPSMPHITIHATRNFSLVAGDLSLQLNDPDQVYYLKGDMTIALFDTKLKRAANFTLMVNPTVGVDGTMGPINEVVIPMFDSIVKADPLPQPDTDHHMGWNILEDLVVQIASM